MTRHKEPELLRELSVEWCRFGCAICSQTAPEWADEGYRVELHHLQSRAQLGPDSSENIVGLCGDFCGENQCHRKVTEHKIDLTQQEWGWSWEDRDSGEVGVLRRIDATMQAEVPVSTASAVAEKGTLALPVRGDAWRPKHRPIPAEWLPEDLMIDGEGEEPAKARFLLASELRDRAEQAWLACALVVHVAAEKQDWNHLGFDSQQEWAHAIGIPASTLSKLKLIASAFQGAWVKLNPADRGMLTLEGLYLAARLVKLGQWSPDHALHEAVSQPTNYLWTQYKELIESEDPRIMHNCPDCGQRHFLKEMGEDSRKGAPGR